MIGAVQTLPDGSEVTLCGWITEAARSVKTAEITEGGSSASLTHWRVELADRSGRVILLSGNTLNQQSQIFERLRAGDVVQCSGTLTPAEQPGVKALTLTNLLRLSTAERLPFNPWHDGPPSSDTRLRYRYLDLRREQTQRRLALRSRAFQSLRTHLLEADFVEVETPLLERYSAANTSAFIVPWTGGESFALPQSPQLYKQLLMVGGCDRYFQFARSFRRETELSAHRKLEFTALDFEMSFVDEEDIFSQTEGLLGQLWSSLQLSGPTPRFEQLSWDEAMEHYGTDSPDLRFGLKLHNITDIAVHSTSSLFNPLRAPSVSPEGRVLAIRIPLHNAQNLTRTRLDNLPMMNPHPKMVTISWLQVLERKDNASSDAPFQFEGPAAVAFNAPSLETHLIQALAARTGASPGDILLILSGTNHHYVTASAAEVRVCLASELELTREVGPIFVWVTGYPYWEYDLVSQGFKPARHPFTLPKQESIAILQEIERLPYLPSWNGEGNVPSTGVLQERATLRYDDDAKQVWLGMRTHGYELSLNGIEVGTGSLRVHTQWIQERIFSMFGYYYEEVYSRFGALMAAFATGVPPHGGISLGIDRILSALTGTRDIDEWTAFPKDSRGTCPMTGAPSSIDNTLLRMTLGI